MERAVEHTNCYSRFVSLVCNPPAQMEMHVQAVQVVFNDQQRRLMPLQVQPRSTSNSRPSTSIEMKSTAGCSVCARISSSGNAGTVSVPTYCASVSLTCCFKPDKAGLMETCRVKVPLCCGAQQAAWQTLERGRCSRSYWQQPA